MRVSTGTMAASTEPSPHDTLIKLLTLSRTLLSTRELDKLLGLIVRAFLQMTEADRAYLLLCQDDGSLKAVHGEARDGKVIQMLGEPRISSLAKQVASTGVPVYSTNVDIDMKLGMRHSISELGLHMIVSVALNGPTGIVGVIYADGKSTLDTVFTASNRQSMEALADHAGAAIENARLFEGAIRDPLTSLFNFGFFQVRLSELCDGRAQLTAGMNSYVALIEMDDMLGIAARLGPQAADDTLRAVADALRRSLQLPEFGARIGTSGVGICFSEPSDDRARARLEKLIQESKALQVPGISDPVNVRLAIGVAPIGKRLDVTLSSVQRAVREAANTESGIELVS
jgi:diguanylate cyclase (GGDEF)-like protein